MLRPDVVTWHSGIVTIMLFTTVLWLSGLLMESIAGSFIFCYNMVHT